MTENTRKEAAIKLAENILADTTNQNHLKKPQYVAILQELGCTQIKCDFRQFGIVPHEHAVYYTHRGLIGEGKEKPAHAELPHRGPVTKRAHFDSIRTLLRAMKEHGLLVVAPEVARPETDDKNWAKMADQQGQSTGAGRTLGKIDLQTILDSWE